MQRTGGVTREILGTLPIFTKLQPYKGMLSIFLPVVSAINPGKPSFAAKERKEIKENRQIKHHAALT